MICDICKTDPKSELVELSQNLYQCSLCKSVYRLVLVKRGNLAEILK